METPKTTPSRRMRRYMRRRRPPKLWYGFHIEFLVQKRGECQNNVSNRNCGAQDAAIVSRMHRAERSPNTPCLQLPQASPPAMATNNKDSLSCQHPRHHHTTAPSSHAVCIVSSLHWAAAAVPLHTPCRASHAASTRTVASPRRA
jgi:hypothetical protein